MQEKMREAEARIAEARRTQAEVLDLGDLALDVLPESLGDLPSLRALYLGRAAPGEDGRPRFQHGRGFSGFTDTSPLGRLRHLQFLDLWGTSIVDLSPLVALQSLHSLNAWRTNVADLSALAGLQALRNLNLGGTSVADLASLATLQTLERLGLSDTSVADLSPLASLQRLQSLDLSETSVADLSPLGALPNLLSLNLSWTSVTDLSPLATLQSLQRLRLAQTSVVDLSPLAALQDLQSLDLSFARVRDPSPVTGLKGLERLWIYGLQAAAPISLRQILADHPRLKYLTAGSAHDVPREALSHDRYEDCLPRLRAYLAELRAGAEPENEVKVILLGNGRVGKTQLCRRFRGQPFDESVESTHGVQIWREELQIRAGGEEQTFQVNWWDFGGQDIYHGTHALFLRSRAVFVILWTPALENRGEFTENGIPLRNQPLAYWLDYVRSLAGEGSPVIVVQSQCDQFADRRPDPPRPEGAGFFECTFYSAKTDLGRETLESHLKNAIGSLLERDGALKIGQGRAEVRRRLYAWRGEDQEREPAERQHRVLTLDQFQELCNEVSGIVSWEHALDYFHHTGVVFYRPDLFSNGIVLDQDWALQAVYTVFHRGKAAPWLRDSGRFTREDLALLAWREAAIDEQRLFLSLMTSCGVCFPCGKAAAGEALYVAPDLLPGFEAVTGRLHAWYKEMETPTLRVEYRFFHQAVIRGLMSEIGWRAGDLAVYWKYGFWFKDGLRSAQLLLRFEDTSTAEAPGSGALVAQAQGRDPLGLLREIRKAIRQQPIREEPEELLTIGGCTVARSALAGAIEGRALDTEGKPVPAAPFAAFFDDRDRDPENSGPAADFQRLDIQPAALAPGEKPAEIYISYAWGDDTPEGKVRTQTVDGLYAALEGDGFRPIRDREAMRSGDRISIFIHQLTRADLVVAVISGKYLRSPSCMFEIYKLWQRSQAEPDLMARCLVPIVVPGLKIGNLKERAPYLEYWNDEAESLEALARNPKLKPGAKSWEEVRLVREFAHHVDDILVFIQDVLMPRSLDALLEDGFLSVRDALRRRLVLEE